MKKLPLLTLIMLAAQLSIAQTVYTITIKSRPTIPPAEANCAFDYLYNAPGNIGSPTSTSMVIADWTSSGTLYIWRSFLRFDLTALPAGAIVDSAFLSLYANPSSPSGNVGNPTWGDDNAVGIYRITSAWDPTTMVWSTQPAYTHTDSAIIPQSTTTSQDYLHINVSGLVKDMVTLGNYGFMFRHLQETTYYNSMIFNSPNTYATDSNRTPTLVIKYTIPSSTGAVNTPDIAAFDLLPNPAKSWVRITATKESNEQADITITDCMGKTIGRKHINTTASRLQETIDTHDYAKGIYQVTLQLGNGNAITKKLVVE